jgi:hypothetical protein
MIGLLVSIAALGVSAVGPQAVLAKAATHVCPAPTGPEPPKIIIHVSNITCEAANLQVVEELVPEAPESALINQPHFWLTTKEVPAVHWQCSTHRYTYVKGEFHQGRTLIRCQHKNQHVEILLEFRPTLYKELNCQTEYNRWRQEEGRAVAEGKSPSTVRSPPAYCQA